jgi:hypothetical protein
MDTLIACIVFFVFGYWLSGFIRDIKEQMEIKKLERGITERLEKFREKVIPSRIEEENGVLYLYNSDTNEFLGQANSFEQLEEAMMAKYPGKLFNVPKDELSKFTKD